MRKNESEKKDNKTKQMDLFYNELSWEELRCMWSKSQHGLEN